MPLSNISDGTTTHEFTFNGFGLSQSIPADASFMIDSENFTTEIENVEGMIHKEAAISGILISDDAGGDSATKKLFSLANFLALNTNTLLTVTIYFDGGDLIKIWSGKIKDAIVSSVSANRPLDLIFSFRFVLTGSSW